MLPLLQMHPQAVPPIRPNLESFAAGLPDSNSLATQPYRLRDASVAHQYSFPIRTSRSSTRNTPVGPVPLYNSLPEHNLRRKTPNGTIDAGYDGSPTQLSPASRPLKHMILTGHANPNYSPQSAQRQTLRQTVTPVEAFLTADHVRDDRVNVASRPAFNANDFLPHHGPGHGPFLNRHSYQSGQHPHHGYQPFIHANEHNVRAFCPPPTPVNESLPFGQVKWPVGALPWDHQAIGLANTLHSKQLPMIPPAAYDSFGPEQLPPTPFSNKTAQGLVINVRNNPYPNPNYLSPLSNAGLKAEAHDKSRPIYPQFKEKALFQAHKSYLDLLAYLQATRKIHHGKVGPSTHPASRLLIYPKPPKPTIKEQVPFEVNQLFLNRSVHRPGALNYSDSSNAFPSRDGSQSFPSHEAVEQGFPPSSSGPPSLAHIPALNNAKSSLQLIRDLCEQGDWKWVDGLLLAGCLEYGLEQYDNALKSFSRITALNPSHVEAIANTAATLYCLDRQPEAEQRWLDAVKLRPDYLEAAEHLVGLLYKKRSKEAVEIIEHVQHALELPKDRSQPPGANCLSLSTVHCPGDLTSGTTLFDYSTGHSGQPCASALDGVSRGPQAPGYGSSGYALPGEENGRILALVHAKGTMLYSLRDVARASEAFEEAVMISIGRCMSGVRDLVQRIQAALSSPDRAPNNSLSTLLLPPEKARLTAQLVFRGTGELPGLMFVPDGAPRRAAIQTTSNSLLSLAKIFQDSVSSGTSSANRIRQPSGVGDILALYYLSLSLQESPSTANNVGILLAGVQHVVASQSMRLESALTQPNVPGIPPGSGLALALAYYHYGLSLDPKHVHLHTNLGSLLKDIGQLDLAIQMYERAVSCDGTFDIALTNLANAVKDRGRITDAISYYRRAVNSNPNFAEAVCGLLTALNSVCDWRGRGGVALGSGKYDRWHVNEEGMLLDARTQGEGSGLTKRAVDIVKQQLDEASHWGQHLLQDHTIRSLAKELRSLSSRQDLGLDKMLRAWAGKPWEGTRLLRLVERATRVIMRKWYMDKYVLHTADSEQYVRPRLPPSLSVPSAPTVLPFHTFTTPLGARDIRLISQRNALRISCSTLRSSWLPAAVYPPPPPPSPRLNVGYVSSDFNNHPLAHLMQSVFGFHDAKRVHAICYATTPSDKSSHRIKIEHEAPVFRDVSNWSPDKLVEQIIKDEIHILVNLNGYTRGARNEIFAARPAPIQMAFMGFAGTMGAEWCDYILADTTAIPPSTLRPWRSNVAIEDVFDDHTGNDDHDWVYSENIIFCRDTFFCCDHAQSCDPGERELSWQDEERRRWEMRRELFPSMSDDTVILGNFNQLYKIEPTTFRTWLRILARVPKAVLWLLRFPEIGETNLRRTAEAWAGSEVASRLVFTDVAPKNRHISRARVCDLFLDTPECNAHTTAADVLWSSTPLLTLPRYSYKMCSRMAASILKGALPKTAEGQRAASELIAADELEYEQTAIRLACELTYKTTKGGYQTGSGRLAEIRKLLWDSKWSCGLFNTHRWVTDVETAYEEAWRRFVMGQGGDIYL